MADSSSLIRETYPLIPPFSYALVATDPETKQTKYTVVEVPLSTAEKEILDMIKNILEEEITRSSKRLFTSKSHWCSKGLWPKVR
ncbi:MAG: hypothetical protein ACXAC6_12270 [Candidatus Hodarchaeales archaeon]